MSLWVYEFVSLWVCVFRGCELMSWCIWELLAFREFISQWIDLSYTSHTRGVFILCWHHKDNKLLSIYRKIKSQDDVTILVNLIYQFLKFRCWRNIIFNGLLYEFIHVLFLMLYLSLLGISSRGISPWIHYFCWRPCRWTPRLSGQSTRTALYQSLHLYWESVPTCFIWEPMLVLIFSFCHCTFQGVLCNFSICTRFKSRFLCNFVQYFIHEGEVVLVWKYTDKNSLLFVLTLKVNMISW